RGVDELDRMERRQPSSGAAHGGRDLDEAARVRARVDVGLQGEHVARLAIAELPRGLRLDEVVDPGAPAADRLLGRLEELELGDGGERGARLLTDALRVGKMARVLEGDAERKLVPLGPRAHLRKEFRDVDDAYGQLGLLEVGAAAGG